LKQQLWQAVVTLISFTFEINDPRVVLRVICSNSSFTERGTSRDSTKAAMVSRVILAWCGSGPAAPRRAWGSPRAAGWSGWPRPPTAQFPRGRCGSPPPFRISLPSPLSRDFRAISVVASGMRCADDRGVGQVALQPRYRQLGRKVPPAGRWRRRGSLRVLEINGVDLVGHGG